MKPSVLLNENGRMPHQTFDAAVKIRRAFPNQTNILLGFFDRSFSQRIVDRYSSADEMKNALEEVAAMKDHQEDRALSIEDIVAALDTQSNNELVRNKQLYDLAMNRVRATHSRILKEVQPTYTSFQTGYVNFTQGLKNTLGFSHFSTLDHRFAPTFLVRVVGEELILTADDEIVHRTSVTTPVFPPELDRKIEQIYLSGLKKLVGTKVE